MTEGDGLGGWLCVHIHIYFFLFCFSFDYFVVKTITILFVCLVFIQIDIGGGDKQTDIHREREREKRKKERKKEKKRKIIRITWNMFDWNVGHMICWMSSISGRKRGRTTALSHSSSPHSDLAVCAEIEIIRRNQHENDTNYDNNIGLRIYRMLSYDWSRIQTTDERQRNSLLFLQDLN